MSLDKSKTKFTFHCKQEANATECPDAATTCASCFQNENGRRDRERFGTPQYWETDFKQCSCIGLSLCLQLNGKAVVALACH